MHFAPCLRRGISPPRQPEAFTAKEPSLIPELAPKTKVPLPIIKDTLAERLRRRPAKPMGSLRVGSNPTGVVFGYNVCLTKFTPASIAQWQSVSLVN